MNGLLYGHTGARLWVKIKEVSRGKVFIIIKCDAIGKLSCTLFFPFLLYFSFAYGNVINGYDGINYDSRGRGEITV